MGLDIRLPIGLMFLTLAPILGGYGLVHQIPMDCLVGAGMLVFGALMALFGRPRRARGARRHRGAQEAIASRGPLG